MELLTTPEGEVIYEILSKDEFDNVLVKYTLDGIASAKWTQSFNKRDSSLDIYSIENTTSLIFTSLFSYFVRNKIEIKNTLSRKIIVTNNEVESDNLKLQTILNLILDSDPDNFIFGMIIMHNGLSYDETNIYIETSNNISMIYNPNQYPDYEFYIRKIAENMNLENF